MSEQIYLEIKNGTAAISIVGDLALFDLFLQIIRKPNERETCTLKSDQQQIPARDMNRAMGKIGRRHE